MRLREDRSVQDFVEKPSSDKIDTNLISAGAYVLEREVLELVPPDRNVSIEREVWPLLVGDGLYGFPSESYWLDIGTPERYLKGTFDIIEGNVDTAVKERLGSDWLAIDEGAEVHGRVIPPAVIERGVRVAEGAHIGSLAVLGGDVSIGAGSHGRARGDTQRDADRRGLHAARLHRRRRLPRGCADPDHRRSGARRGRDRRGGQRDHARGAYLPWCHAARRRDQVLGFSPGQWPLRSPKLPDSHLPSPTGGEQLMSDGADRHIRPTLCRARRSRRSTPPASSATCWRCPSTCATRCGASESAIMPDWDTSAGLVVAGMGGSAIGGALARAALGDHASRPIFVTRAYGLPPWTTPDTTVLLRELLGQHRGDARLLRVGGALGARRTVVTTGGRLAEMARADGVPVIPLPGGFQPRAAVAYMTVAALEVAALCGAGPRLTSEIDVAASHTEQLVAEWGPDAPEDSLAKDDRPRAATARRR